MSTATFEYGPDFYDAPEVFPRYQETRAVVDEGNATLEEPYVLAFLGDLEGRSVLDLGCGDGKFGEAALRAGAVRYHGVDGSERMLAAAAARLAPAMLERADLNAWTCREPGAWDAVTARMVVHYLDDLPALLREVRTALAPGGRFVLSVEHPVVTCAYDGDFHDGVPSEMRVRGYFDEGERACEWLDSSVRKVHRTVETYVRDLLEAGLTLTGLSEGRPVPDNFQDPGTCTARRAVPMYLTLRAEKPVR
ncbi:SAM-dependent methyltransferase [Streptomyces sp. WAC 01529]|uniref:class I SAM-dependent DNA methyltransferase n=1 Tax=Streptomyces sp. WAC 01529 TaxID=2203205 RepID=UPI000F6F809B|nr:class I SAM-dependent methyltransferase [Streptomyces sp. WAC 01529]AZM51951.1 SAM-dependent methyltransferase [Streptomyces sp. WAC 01529]